MEKEHADFKFFGGAVLGSIFVAKILSLIDPSHSGRLFGPKWPQGGAKMALNGPNMAQNGPKMVQDSPKMAPR